MSKHEKRLERLLRETREALKADRSVEGITCWTDGETDAVGVYRAVKEKGKWVVHFNREMRKDGKPFQTLNARIVGLSNKAEALRWIESEQETESQDVVHY